MFGFGNFAFLTGEVAKLYKDFVTTKVQFEELRRFAKESMDEFKRLIERQSDKIERIERERIKAEAELLAKINGLEARLAALSERALHVAAADAVAEFAKRRLAAPASSDGGEKASSTEPG